MELERRHSPHQASERLPSLVEEHSDATGAFECNICYDLAREPVVTMCGHLYCWPCIYRWMQVQSHCRVCPLCKAGIDVEQVIPIYGRGADQTDPRSAAEKDILRDGPPAATLPRRPLGQRPAPIHRSSSFSMTGTVQPSLQFIPSIFGFNSGSGHGHAEPLTPEQQHQAFLSRLLLMLGSFVIMCLLLF
ncbi:hypothetical protein WJX73_007996 [Symbiochloris irregularis]|uniref:RING-type E3 ubiquitin transferase n=1 Tax=Symbiochloris irregularis TaxID=706552 RepID=A0AAW1PK65_9CHLO